MRRNDTRGEVLHRTILRVFDIPQGILLSMGFNVLIAEDGTRYPEKDFRSKCIRALTEHATTMTDSQSGTGSEEEGTAPPEGPQEQVPPQQG